MSDRSQFTESRVSLGSHAESTVELLDHQHTRLIGASLRWKRYRAWNSAWAAGRCELCATGFTEGGTPGLNSGYSVVGGGPAGQDDYRWICAICYETHRDHFCWTVLDTRGAVAEPPGLLEATFEWIGRQMELATADGSDVDEPLPARGRRGF
jgi:hypothetical protein